MVVEVQLEDIPGSPDDPLKGLKYQMEFEKLAFAYGGEGQIAPGQRLTDFLNGKTSANLPETSYHPGVAPSPIHEWMPVFISQRLKEGFKEFGRKMVGFETSEALLIGVESRTSSPVRIPRDAETMQHPQVKGLYPCAEGAGYAGGIVSSAVDGQNCAVMAARFLNV